MGHSIFPYCISIIAVLLKYKIEKQCSLFHSFNLEVSILDLVEKEFSKASVNKINKAYAKSKLGQNQDCIGKGGKNPNHLKN